MDSKHNFSKKALVVTIALLLALIAGGWYYFAIYKQQAVNRQVCASIDDEIISDAASMIANSQPEELSAIINKFEQDCADYKESADYWYVALNRSIILSSHAEARDDLEQFKSLPKQEIRLAKYMQVQSIEELEDAVEFLGKTTEDASGGTLFIPVPEGL